MYVGLCSDLGNTHTTGITMKMDAAYGGAPLSSPGLANSSGKIYSNKPYSVQACAVPSMSQEMHEKSAVTFQLDRTIRLLFLITPLQPQDTIEPKFAGESNIFT